MKKEFSDIEFEMFTMPFGLHIKKSINEMPASYLLWLVDQSICPDIVKAYVDLNEEDLQEEAEEEEEDLKEY